jgi:Dna[CI] antecedent, DciA
MTEPRKAGDFLRQIVREVGVKRTRDAYATALDQILPPTQRDHCQVMGFRDGKLTLEIDSAPLFAELSGFRRDEIRLRINEVVQGRKVARLQFRLGGTGHV